MLQAQFIREERSQVIAGLKKRNWNDDQIKVIDVIIQKDDRRKELKTSHDESNAQINKLSEQIGEFYKSGKRSEAEQLKSQVIEIKDEAKAIEDQLKETEIELEHLLYTVPNIPHESVPAGNTEEHNMVFQDWDKPFTILHDGAKPHWELMEDYELVNFEMGVKIAGAGFPLYRGKGSKLQRALINFFIDEATNAGYEEVIPPLLVNEITATGTGQLPDKEAQMYHTERDNLYLIPTAEVPLTNMYRDDIIKLEDLPLKITGYTPCFRREAGSYGAHVKGLNRVHQFDKIEIVQIQEPEKSYDTLNEMRDHIEGLLKKLGLPYRILVLCGGDIGFTAALTYDFEVYSIAQERWLEVSSVSNFETFQSNRMKLRYRDENGKIHLTHTLNGSALALARIFASILENYQTEAGIVIPEALRNYTGFDIIN